MQENPQFSEMQTACTVELPAFQEHLLLNMNVLLHIERLASVWSRQPPELCAVIYGNLPHGEGVSLPPINNAL